MRYQSAPVIPEERQETTRERAARQRRERQEELRYTASDEKRWKENRERVLRNGCDLEVHSKGITVFVQKSLNGIVDIRIHSFARPYRK